MGFAVGYALKKIIKIALVVLGIFVMALLYLSNKGIIDVHYDALAREIENALGSAAGEATSMKAYIIANVPFAATFLAGVYLGLKKG